MLFFKSVHHPNLVPTPFAAFYYFFYMLRKMIKKIENKVVHTPPLPSFAIMKAETTYLRGLLIRPPITTNQSFINHSAGTSALI